MLPALTVVSENIKINLYLYINVTKEHYKKTSLQAAAVKVGSNRCNEEGWHVTSAAPSESSSAPPKHPSPLQAPPPPHPPPQNLK